MPVHRSLVGRVGDTRHLTLPIADLVGSGVLPDGAWRPAAWYVLIQTVGDNGVPSALAPVGIQLQVRSLETGGFERRHPAVLEWVPHPIHLAPLPAEDVAAEVGFAHVPVPVSPTFADQGLAGVRFGRHPAGVRAVRFRWNQGPSASPAYPLELTAGYRLAELDVDAHTSATFADDIALRRALRDIQDVQMLPSDQLLLAPGDTLATSQWEAWYASDSQRTWREDGTRGTWYSWRESFLEWPAPQAPIAGRPTPPVHPILAGLLDRLQQPDPSQPAAYVVAGQARPPTQPADLAGLFATTAPKTDPYGWNVLQRFGLSVAFTLHDRLGRMITGGALLDLVRAAIASHVKAKPEDGLVVAKHLHVELLFQPNKSVRLAPAETDEHELLGLLQISLRPAVRQDQGYVALLLNRDHGRDHQYLVTSPEGATAVTAEDAAPIDVPANQPVPVPVRAGDPGGPAYPVFRYHGAYHGAVPEIAVQVAPNAVGDPEFNAFYAALAAFFAGLLRYDPGPLPRLTLLRSLTGQLNSVSRRLLESVLQGAPAGTLEALLAFEGMEAVAVTDDRTHGFTVPLAVLAERFAEVPPGDRATQWGYFKRYAEASGSNDPQLPPSAKITVPTAQADIDKILDQFASWSQRFFDACGRVTPDGGLGVAESAGPWTATAYLRASTPAYAAPDETNRLTHVQLIEDRWAHVYRYYLQPYSRYDLLWRSLRHSPALFAKPGDAPALITVNALDGGLDVVIDRTQAVAMPLILSSRRLDEPATPARPPVPGRTWEVIVARHPEQALMERNQTLVRQLSYRQIAFTLLRRFGAVYEDWRLLFPEELPRLRQMKDVYPPIASSLVDPPDHVDLDHADAATVRSLDLPERLGAFQQGALVLQWEGLPFYYEHRLLVIAQTDSTVSPPNSTTQNDFEYRSPVPSAQLGAADGFVIPSVRVLRVPVRRLWDSLPPHAQGRWPDEQPEPLDSPEPERRPGALPDFAVTYQLVDLFGGNVEVQHEIAFDLLTETRIAIKTLADHFLIDFARLQPPAGPQDLFYLFFAIPEVTRLALAVLRFRQGAPEWPGGRPFGLSLEPGGVLVFEGALTHGLLEFLKEFVRQAGGAGQAVDEDIAALNNAFTWWTRREPISGPPAGPPNVVEVRFEQAPDTTLVWDGPLTGEDESALGALGADEAFTGAIQALIAKGRSGVAAGEAVSVTVAPGPGQPPPAVAPKVTFTTDVGTRAFIGVTWTGALFDQEAVILREWARPIAAFASAVEEVVSRRDGLSVEMPPVTPDQFVGLHLPAVDIDGLASLWSEHVREENGRLFWKGGRLAGPGELRVLDEVVSLIDIIPPEGPLAALPAALAAVLFGLQEPVSVGFGAPVPPRPAQAELGALADKLMIATFVMTYQGHMTPGDAKLLKDALAPAVDKRAVRRLYRAALFSGPPGRESTVRTRRGTAAPSELVAWEPMPLPEGLL
jgi:hypothetical protein